MHSFKANDIKTTRIEQIFTYIEKLDVIKIPTNSVDCDEFLQININYSKEIGNNFIQNNHKNFFGGKFCNLVNNCYSVF